VRDERFVAALAVTQPEQPLPFRAAIDVLGIALRVEADHPALLDAAVAALGGARMLEAARSTAAALELDAGPRLVLRTTTDSTTRSTGTPLDHGTARDGQLLFAGAGCRGRVDLERNFAIADIAPGLLRDEVRSREVLHAFVLVMLTRMDRQPVHAAAVALGDRGLLLAGPSGTGKSTLACAAAVAGLRVLSDDTVFVQLQPQTRIRAMPGPLFLPPSAAARFPDAVSSPVVRANGKVKIAMPGPDTCSVVERVGLCVLEPPAGAAGDAERAMHEVDPGVPALEPIAPETAIARVLDALSPGFDVFGESLAPRLRACTRLGSWRLRLTDDPHAAARLLVETLRTLEARGIPAPPPDG
jgi:hypothetical protein